MGAVFSRTGRACSILLGLLSILSRHGESETAQRPSRHYCNGMGGAAAGYRDGNDTAGNRTGSDAPALPVSL